MSAPAKTTTLHDYFVSTRLARLTPLRDFQGAIDSKVGLAYRLGRKIIRVNNDVVSRITGVPAQFRDNWEHLTDSSQRRMLARALVDDRFLTHRRRRAIFSILLWSSLVLWAIIGFAVVAFQPAGLGTYKTGYSLFFYSLATSIFLPTPFEIILKNGVESLGIFWTIGIAATAKTAGSWLVLMMGDKANEGLEQLLSKNRPLRSMFSGLERFAQKYGYFAIFVLFAIPFMSDTIPLFILAVLHMKKFPFLVVTCAAIIVRSLLFIYAGDAVETLRDWAAGLF